jgi:NADH-quinone oxidoreductase subunit L
LDNQLYNIFDIISFSVTPFFGGFTLNFSAGVFEKLLLLLLNPLPALILFSIIFFLLRNMFGYSICYYLINYIFDKYLLSVDFLAMKSRRSFFILTLFTRSGLTWPSNLPYAYADTLLLIVLLMSLLAGYWILLEYNSNFCPIQLAEWKNILVMKWMSFSSDFISIGFLIDHLSILMLVVVLSISMFVHYYSLDYMAGDPWLLTFMKYLSGSTLAMVILVTANNLALVFLGWEGVGIFSYLLIGFWYTRTLALKASLKAVIVNWIGDIALIIAAALLLHFFGTLDFYRLEFLLWYLFDYKINAIIVDFFLWHISIFSIIGFFLLIAAVGKSAQFGLHTWLPDAMEGPTPVSALIHAATMVTAGVYLIVRTSFIFELSETAWMLTLLIGSFTAVFASITACFQYDIKWIIAFSTCSQLGYMFLACGLSAYNLAMFHLFIHAFFKALLFLCSGSVIHAIADEQDIWKMGGLWGYLPITYTGFCIGFFSLAGLPFTSGFFSKDTIIELALTNWTVPGLYAYICASIGAWATAFYSFRFFYFVMFQNTWLSRTVLSSISEHGQNILKVIIALSTITIIIGGFTKNPLSNPIAFIYFSDSIFVGQHFYFNFYETFLHFYVTIHTYLLNYIKFILFLIPLWAIYFSICGYWYIDFYHHYIMVGAGVNETIYFYLWTAWNLDERLQMLLQQELYHGGGYTPIYWAKFYRFFETKGGTDQLYNWYLVKPLLHFSYVICYKELDRGWLEFLFIKVPSLVCYIIGKNLTQNLGSLKMNFLPALVFIGVLFGSIIFLLLP